MCVQMVGLSVLGGAHPLLSLPFQGLQEFERLVLPIGLLGVM